jgi:DNA (cytosine-5)-methyltransferase 1
MRFVDLFAGLGGFNLAASSLGGRCVFACEIDDELRDIYQKNFGRKPEGDIRELDTSSIPKHDLLCAGFPCQPFSKAGDQRGLKDKIRGTIFFNVIEILRVCKPTYVILENVAHFVQHDSGNTYRRVERALRSLGYDVRHAKLSPHRFGIPQIRERMYMVGRMGQLNGFQFPQPISEETHLSIKSVLDVNPPDAIPLSPQIIRCLDLWEKFIKSFPSGEKLPSFPIWSMEFGATYPTRHDSLHKISLTKLRQTAGSFGVSLNRKFRREMMELVPSHARASEGAFPRWKQTFIRQNRELYERHAGWIDKWLPSIMSFPSSLQKLEWNCQGEDRTLWDKVIQFRASGVRVKRATTSPSLVAMTATQVPIIAWERRYMTVRECARLQSLDELATLPSGEAAVQALGNAVNVEVARRILEPLLKC